MLEEALFSGTTKILEKALDVRMMRHQVIASNIANAETPGYRAVDIDFTQTMRNVISRMNGGGPIDDSGAGEFGAVHELSLTNADLAIVTDDKELVGEDSNTVALEKEIGKLQQNKVLYEVVAQLLAQRLHALSDVITNRGAG